MISADGELLDYAKLHPFSYGEESLHFKGGGTLPVCSLQNFQIGVQICYDLRFPEPFQILSKSAEPVSYTHLLLQIVKACLFFFLKSLYNKILMENGRRAG